MMTERKARDFDHARHQIEEQETSMNSMIAEEERLLFIAFQRTHWGSPDGTVA